jgi:hypothetical protein
MEEKTMNVNGREQWKERIRSNVSGALPAIGVPVVVLGLYYLAEVFVLHAPGRWDSAREAVIHLILGALLLASSMWVDKGEAFRFGVVVGLFVGAGICGGCCLRGLAMALTQTKRWEWLGLAVFFFILGALQTLALRRRFKRWQRELETRTICRQDTSALHLENTGRER